MSVGSEAVDEDHRKLVIMLNRMHDVLQEEASTDVIAEVLGEMLEYTHYHFEFEEAVMRQSGFPELEQHIVLHRTLTGRALEFLQRFKDEPSILLAYEILGFLSDWLTRHILRDDMKYRPYVARQG
ncbi:MAG: bacteriohemerythrin [Rhodospirillales bacterium]|nr:bacteriohemerythrin [Rhodospirillales bacterium]